MRQRWLPKLTLTPTLLAVLVFVYGFILWTGGLSFTNSGMIPRYEWVGLQQYFRLWHSLRWQTAVENVIIFASLFVTLSLAVGLFLAILLDQKIRLEGVLRTLYLYPMALSFIVTGTAWKWILNPSQGVEMFLHRAGWSSASFDWLVNPDRSIYTVVIAGIWQASGFVMVLFLAGLRAIDPSLVQAARIDGASLPTIYRRILIPSLRPVFLSALVVLSQTALKSFDLVIALTGGGPGYSSDVPALYMYTSAFDRSQLGLASASAVMMLFAVIAIIGPYLYLELRGKSHA